MADKSFVAWQHLSLVAAEYVVWGLFKVNMGGQAVHLLDKLYYDAMETGFQSEAGSIHSSRELKPPI